MQNNAIHFQENFKYNIKVRNTHTLSKCVKLTRKTQFKYAKYDNEIQILINLGM